MNGSTKKQLAKIARQLLPVPEEFKVQRTGQYLLMEHEAQMALLPEDQRRELMDENNQPIHPKKKYDRVEIRETDHLTNLIEYYKKSGMGGAMIYVKEVNAFIAENLKPTDNE